MVGSGSSSSSVSPVPSSVPSPVPSSVPSSVPVSCESSNLAGVSAGALGRTADGSPQNPPNSS